MEKGHPRDSALRQGWEQVLTPIRIVEWDVESLRAAGKTEDNEAEESEGSMATLEDQREWEEEKALVRACAKIEKEEAAKARNYEIRLMGAHGDAQWAEKKVGLTRK